MLTGYHGGWSRKKVRYQCNCLHFSMSTSTVLLTLADSSVEIRHSWAFFCMITWTTSVGASKHCSPWEDLQPQGLGPAVLSEHVQDPEKLICPYLLFEPHISASSALEQGLLAQHCQHSQGTGVSDRPAPDKRIQSKSGPEIKNESTVWSWTWAKIK